jgi:uncharacterized protein (UPF0261 family)
MARVLVIGTMDTKGRECAYVAEQLRAHRCEVSVMDVGILGEAEEIVCEIGRREVADAAGTTIEALREAGSRGRAVEGMCRGARLVARRLRQEGRIHGALSLGGAEGAVLAASVMHELPLGMPKTIVSPIASGRRTFGPFMGSKDVAVVHSVVDILGLNAIARRVFDTAAAATAAAARHYEANAAACAKRPSRPQVGATMLGNTTAPLMWIRRQLEPVHGDLVVFHANGVGGVALEEQIDAGYIDAVLDYTLSEITAHVAGGYHDAGPHRLEAAGRRGLPQVIVPGCVDFMVCGPRHEVPRAWRDRPQYFHNPEFTLVRATRDEQLEVARRIARKLCAARGPVTVLVPLRGLSIPNCEADQTGQPGPFWDPSLDAAFRDELRRGLAPQIEYAEIDAHINDVEFARAVFETARATFNL